MNDQGRLWAALIQLCHDDGELYQMKVLKCALQAVPKSGEVWCEGEVTGMAMPIMQNL